MVTLPSNSLDTYGAVLDFLADCGASKSLQHPVPLKFLEDHKGLHQLYGSMSAVAPATPGAADEEWNPLSQRPHAPLPPSVSADDLGSEVIILKEAVEAFTTLSHEMMHVALWEPFFTGTWRPQNRQDFVTFSLMAEGFCFFYTDILISSTVRVGLPDGEFALERQSPGNVRFHPMRAFEAAGIREPREILDIYLEGFGGQTTKLWQRRGSSAYGASLAAQAFHFYQGSLGYLGDLHRAIGAWGGLGEFYRRFCQIPGLPSLLGDNGGWGEVRRESFKAYFEGFFQNGLSDLQAMKDTEGLRVRWRRMLQMRASYGLQVRWLLEKGHWTWPGTPKGKSHVLKDLPRIKASVASYLEDLRALLLQLAGGGSPGELVAALESVDARYEKEVRSFFCRHHLWVGQRWLIAPKRGGGLISLTGRATSGSKRGGMSAGKTIDYLLEELALSLATTRSKSARGEIYGQIQRLANLGGGGAGAGQRGGRDSGLKVLRALGKELSSPLVLPLWSVPLASFDPLHNRYRELVFSYQ